MSFDKIYYKDKEVERDVNAGNAEVAYFQHIYRTTFMTIVDDKFREHACVLYGYRCWQQITRHPIQSLKQWRQRRAHKK